ncbi:MAG: class I SAM-dependent methyltransferase [Candidatus Aenigmarchaeota archaeon]|nr:class I SAM-dependent methyltransferase [Candidatus Aenigmarchaeota archaeon]
MDGVEDSLVLGTIVSRIGVSGEFIRSPARRTETNRSELRGSNENTIQMPLNGAYQLLQTFINDEDDLFRAELFADEVLRYPIQKILMAGNGLFYAHFLLALTGKKVTFVDQDSQTIWEAQELMRRINNRLRRESKHGRLAMDFVDSEIGELDIDRHGLLRNSYDLVTFFDLLGFSDAVGNPRTWLPKAQELMKPEGYLVIDESIYSDDTRTENQYIELLAEELNLHFPDHQKIMPTKPHRRDLPDVFDGNWSRSRSSNRFYKVENTTVRSQNKSSEPSRSELRQTARRINPQSTVDGLQPSRDSVRHGVERIPEWEHRLLRRGAPRNDEHVFNSLDPSVLISNEARSELRTKLKTIVAGILMTVTLHTQTAFGNLLNLNVKEGTAKINLVSKNESVMNHSSAVEQAPRVSRTEIIGILPHLARSLDIVTAVIANNASRNKIVILTDTPSWRQLIEEDILSKMPEVYRKQVLILDRIDQAAIFENDTTAIFKAFGRPEDQSYLKEQVLKLLQDYKVEEEIHPIEIIAEVLGISEHLRMFAQDARSRWMYEVMA